MPTRASEGKTEFCGACVDCRRNGESREQIFLKRVPGTSTYVVSSKKYAWLQYKKRQIQAPGTTFSTFSDEVRLEGGHGNCCRFATHGSAPRSPCLPCQIKKKIGARAELRNVLQEKLRGRGGSSCRFDRLQKNYLWATQHRRHKKKSLAGRYHIPSPEKKTPSV